MNPAIRAVTIDVSGLIRHRAMVGICDAFDEAQSREAARLAGNQAAIDDAALVRGIGGGCKCENMDRWSLPYCHWLWQCIQSNRIMPKSFIHPRWYLFRIYKAERALQWRPSWDVKKPEAMPAIPPRNVGLSYFFHEPQALSDCVVSLSLPEREKVAEIFAYKCDEILQMLDLTAEAAAMPSTTKFDVLRKVWKAPLQQKKSHGPVAARLINYCGERGA